MIRNISFLSGLLLLLFITGCSSPRVLRAENAGDANMSTYKTFDFFKLDPNGDTSATGFNQRITKLEDAIALQLQKHGYLLSKTNPDLLINIGLVEDEETDTKDDNDRPDAPRYITDRRYSLTSNEVEADKYKEGTMTIDFVDRGLNKLVWKGTVQGIIPERESKLDASIKQGISNLFDKFPG